jgi:hypothetical protein
MDDVLQPAGAAEGPGALFAGGAAGAAETMTSAVRKFFSGALIIGNDQMRI